MKMNRRDALVGLAALPAWARAADGAPAPAAGRRLRDGLGLNVKFGQGQPLHDLPMLREIGVRWVRDYVPWRVLEPEAGRYESGPAAWRERLAFYREHDIGVVFLLVLSNESAYPPSASAPFRHTDPAAFASFAVAVARMLREAGVRFVLEIGNEPHSSFLHKQMGGDWSGRPPSPWLDHYLKLARAAVDKVKSVDASIRLLSDDDMWITHYRYLDAGLPPAIDGFAVHPYDPHGPERTTHPQAEWMKPHRIADDDASLVSAVRRLRDRGQERLEHRPQIWFTEWGWPVGTEPPRFVSEELQAARLPRAFIVAEAAGVEALCWFSSADVGEGTYGLIGRAGRRRPAYETFRVLARELGDWSLQSQVIGMHRPTEGLQGFLFRSGAQSRLALWNADETERPVTLSGFLRQAEGIDAMGRALSMVGGDRRADGLALKVGALPVYLRGFEAPAQVDDWQRHVL